MYCLTDNGNGSYSLANPQPTDINNCVNIIAQPADVQTSLWSLTADQGTTIGSSILLVWAIAWTYRAVLSMLEVNFSEPQERE